MNERLIFLALILITFVYIFINQNYSEQNGFVENKTVVNYSDLFFYYEIVKYPSSVNITELGENVTLGFVGDTWNLNFGNAPVNLTQVKRFIILTNPEEKNQKISFKVYGDIKPLIELSENNFILHKNESKKIEVYLSTESAKVGSYSGEIDVVIQKPKNDLIYSILGWS